MPQISIIVPVYNVEKYLNRCVNSILTQTFSDFELILVDDGSPDNCGKICDEYAEKDSRIHVIHKENGGLSDARNAGLDWIFENSDSEWVSFIDSDDWVHPKYLELLYEAIKENCVNISCCQYLECYSQKDETDITPRIILYSGEEFCVKQNLFSHSACGRLYNKEYWVMLRFPKGKLFEDAFTVHKILLPAEKLAFVDNLPLYFINVENTESITRSDWNPKKMDLLEALEQKIKYSYENSYLEYYKIQVCEYIRTCRLFIVLAEETNNEHSVPLIKKKLRKALRKGRNEKIFPFCEENLWIYEGVYAHIGKMYWLKKRLMKKLLQ